MTKALGNLILAAVKRGRPILTNGKTSIYNAQKFSLKNPYIQEVLPESSLAQLSVFEGKKLSTVCRIIDNPDSAKIMQRYDTFVKTFSKGFSDKEIKALITKAALGGKHPSNSNLDAMVYLTKLDGNVAQHFDAHGIAKGLYAEQLEQLNNLLTKGIDKNKKFFTAPLDIPNNARAGAGAALGTSGGCAARDGSFIIVSAKGKKIADNGIETVIVNDVYYNIINDLAKKFPTVKFIKAENAPEYFNRM